MVTKKKLTILLPDESLDALEYLAVAGSTSKTSALIKAIKVYQFLLERKFEGKKVLLRDERADTTQEVILI